jgi:hypothetical protein
MPYDYCDRFGGQSLRHHDSELAHHILLNTSGVGAKVKLKLLSAN